MAALTTYAEKSNTIQKGLKELHRDLLKNVSELRENTSFHGEYIEIRSKKITVGLSALESIIDFVANKRVRSITIEGTINERVIQVGKVVKNFVREILRECKKSGGSITEKEKTAINEMLEAFKEINGALMQLNIKSEMISSG